MDVMLRFITLSLNQVLGPEEKRSILVEKRQQLKGLTMTLNNECRRSTSFRMLNAARNVDIIQYTEHCELFVCLNDFTFGFGIKMMSHFSVPKTLD